MDKKIAILVLCVFLPVCTFGWRSLDRAIEDGGRRDMRRVHYHQKRHMLPPDPEHPSTREKKRSSSPKPRDVRKKPSGHLTPLEEDEIENDEVVSVAIGPPPMRPKFEKTHRKSPIKKTQTIQNIQTNNAATNLVREVLSELGREFLMKEVNENFIFGQYVGNSMKNMTNELRISLQHDILDMILKVQKKEKGETQEKGPTAAIKEMKLERKFTGGNETDENWPDFSNLEKIVG